MSSLTNEEVDRKSRECYETARAIKQDGPDPLNKALKLLNTALQLNPCFINALVFRASLLSKISELQAAISDLTLAIQLERVQVPLDRRRLALTYGNRASLWAAMDSFKDVQLDLCEAAELEPDNGTWLYELGIHYHRQGNLLFAKRFFAASLQTLALTHMNTATQYKSLLSLGTCCIASDTDYALEILTKAKGISDTAVLCSLIGLAFYHKASFKLAVEHFSAALEKDPQNTEYHTKLAMAWFRMGHAEDAQRHFNEAIFRDCTNAVLLFYRGCVNLKMSLPDRSLVDFDEAIRINAEPRFFHAKGTSFIDQGRLDEAREEFLKVLSLQPDHRLSLIRLGLIAHAEKKLYEALKSLHAALELHWDDAFALHRTAIVYAELDHHTAAIRFLRQCCRLQPRDGTHVFRLAVSCLDNGDPLGALEAITIAMDELGYNRPLAAHVRSSAFRQLKKLDFALHWISKAIEWAEGESAIFYLHRTSIELEQGKFEDCIADATRSLMKTDSKPPCAAHLTETDRSQAHYLRAQACFSLGKMDLALEDLHLAAELQPRLAQHPVFNYVFGVVLANSACWEEAQKAFTDSICAATCLLPPAAFVQSGAEEQSSLMMRSTLVLAYHERAKARQLLGDACGALEDFNEVIQAQPDNRNALIRRAFALKTLGQFEASSRDWQLSKSLDEEDCEDQVTLDEAWASIEIPFVELCLPGEEDAKV